jgi:endogenous inhibitor of DNA gyrase (YacG/DUF329 family)
MCKKVLVKPKRYSYKQFEKTKFCSKKCQGKWRSLYLIGENHHSYINKKNKCLVCGEEFKVANHNSGRKYCSKKCFSIAYTGKKMTSEQKKRMSEAKIGKSTPWMNGANNHFWKGGIWAVNRREKDRIMHRLEYKNWRRTILERDEYKCQWCGSTENLHVDHIKPFCTHKNLRLVIDNGRTLCFQCHKKTDTYGRKKQKEMIKPVRIKELLKIEEELKQ